MDLLFCRTYGALLNPSVSTIASLDTNYECVTENLFMSHGLPSASLCERTLKLCYFHFGTDVGMQYTGLSLYNIRIQSHSSVIRSYDCVYILDWLRK